jgi:signal transduction histidine kinase/ActR/RegA family two-component response regulator
MTFRRGLPALLLLLWLLATFGQPAAARTASAVHGQVALEVPASPVPLEGEWGFAWERFVDPAWQQLPTTDFVTVPSSWNDATAGGKPAGQNNGWGSYVLQVNCPAGQSLAVEAFGQRTASRLYVNGTLVAQHGEPGPSAAQTWAAVHNRVPITRSFPCPLRLTLHVSNFDHRAGGFVRPVWVAPTDVLVQHRESRIIHDAGLLTAYLVTGLVALIFFAVRRRERVPLVFGLFCLAMAVYTDMIGERLLLRPFPAQVSWLAYMRAEYLSWVAAMALFFLTLRGLFPQEIHRRVVQGVVATLALAAVAIVVLPPGVYSHMATPGQAVAVGVALYVAAAMLRARHRTPVDAAVLLAGMVAVLGTLAIDLLLIDTPGPDRKFSPIGFALFMLSPAVVIARRLSHALNAEERNRTLEENARLREDVERMSRHDLKTPLNSILGATRLLRDDTRLTTEQRELVGVLQRAGFRMLEMVNLSLGLFKMETGTYDFRPQAVDLREVVTRVLVDLHSYAEAAGVTLHMEGSDRTPVYVRGEELLCYSIIANLVKNAVEAAGPGQRVSVTLMRGDPVVLAVHNPGEVPAEIAGRFFEKYVTSGKSAGTGLGTYSARLMARAQLGDLQLHTGRSGTTLTLSLRPLKEEPPAPLPPTLAERPAAEWVSDMPPRDVLVVDDDEYTRLVTRRFLPRPPFTVETAANGHAAMEAMNRHWPHFLLLDIEMPVRSGIDTVRWVREQEAAHGLPRCLVVMLSGNDDRASAKRALAAGANRFLVKPVSREALLSTLRDLELNGSGPAPLATGPAALSTMPAPLGPATDLGGLPDEVIVVDPDWMEVFPGFVQTQRNTVEAMARALAAGDREDVQFLAHRAAGGLAAMGLQWAAQQARTVERDAPRAAPETLERIIAGLREHLRNVRIESA